MCTDHDSRPPIEPISGAALDAGPITLAGEDGTEFRAFLARPVQGTGAGIVILPDVRGLHPFFEELALRYAERGITALAIDYFGRTAGSEPRGDDFDHQPHVADARWENLAGDIRSAVARIREEPGVRSVLTTGFCMGGRLSSMSATLGLGLAGVIPFYGWPVGPNRNGTPAPAENAERIECDVLAIYGGADEGIPASARNEYDKALDRAGVNHETLVYPRAPHGFFDRKAAQFADEAAEAWDQVLTFIRRHTMGQPFAGGPGIDRPAEAPGGRVPGPDRNASESRAESGDPRIAHWTGDD